MLIGTEVPNSTINRVHRTFTDNDYQLGDIPDQVTGCIFLDTTKLAKGCSYFSDLTTDAIVKPEERRPSCCCFLAQYRYDTSHSAYGLFKCTANLHAELHRVQPMWGHFYFELIQHCTRLCELQSRSSYLDSLNSIGKRVCTITCLLASGQFLAHFYPFSSLVTVTVFVS